MPFRQPSGASAPGKGTTREVDVTIDPSDLSTVSRLRFRSGVTMSSGASPSGCVWGQNSGRQCLDISSGLGYGLAILYGFPLTIQRVTNKGALALRSGVVRFVSSMAVGDLTGVAPNSDVGINIIIGQPSGMTDLSTANNTHNSGTSGWQLTFHLDGSGGGQWYFRVKQPDTAAGVFSESTAIDPVVQATLSSGQPSEIEFRCLDATPALPAKMQLWINGVKILTRYWEAGQSADALLPPMGLAAAGVTGTILQMMLRNTSTGPTHIFFFEPSMITGPADAGTL